MSAADARDLLHRHCACAVHPPAVFRCRALQTGLPLAESTSKKRWHADCFTSTARIFRALGEEVSSEFEPAAYRDHVLPPVVLRSAPAPRAKAPEKEQLKLGFIKLTDMAPLAIAYEKGFFEDEGLYVTLEPQANWKVMLDRVITGELDGAHMLAGQPLGATVGFGTKADVVTAFSMDLNGNAITVSNEVWGLMKARAASMRRASPCIRSRRGAQAGAREIQGRGQAVQDGAWSSRSRRTTTSCATGSRPAASIPASTRRGSSALSLDLVGGHLVARVHPAQSGVRNSTRRS